MQDRIYAFYKGINIKRKSFEKSDAIEFSEAWFAELNVTKIEMAEESE